MADPVGLIGLGNMGSAMAGSLLDDGVTVIGCDVDARRRDDHVRRGGTCVASPAEVLARSDVVILSLPHGDALRQVVAGEHGLVGAARPGVVVVETGTFALDDKQWARDTLDGAGIALVDCPISGTAGQARKRDLVFYASGDDEHLQRVEPLLRSLGRGAPRVGTFGAGTTMKLVSNLLVTVHTVAAAEALNLASRAGLDRGQALELLTSGSGTSRMLEVRGPMMVDEVYPGDSATVRLLAKDVHLILELAGDRDVPTPLLSVASTMLAAARGQGLGDADPAAVAAALAAMSMPAAAGEPGGS